MEGRLHPLRKENMILKGSCTALVFRVQRGCGPPSVASFPPTGVTYRDVLGRAPYKTDATFPPVPINNRGISPTVAPQRMLYADGSLS